MSSPFYTQYKESGVQWLGGIPEHWKVRRLKEVGVLKGGAGFPPDLQDVAGEELPFYKVGDLKASTDGRLMTTPEHTISKEIASKLRAAIIPKDSILYAKIGAALSLNRRRVTFGNCCIDNNMTAYIPQKKFIQTSWAFYWLSSLDFSTFKNPGAVPSFSEGDQGVLPILVPPISEQTQIAEFLDNETAKIDQLIAEQRRLMELLKEKRQAVISNAVSKGLNPRAPMKPSGIEWLGDVPAHWGINSVGHILDAIGDVDHFMPESVENGVPYLMTGDLKEFLSDVRLHDCKQVSRTDYLKLSKRIKSSKGDVIMARYATIGTSMYVDIDVDFLVSYSCVTLKTNSSKVFGLYLFQYMKSDAFHKGVENQINTNTQGNVGIKDLQNVKIAVAPVAEQIAITAFLDTEFAKFDALTTEAQRAIDLLQERRTALISAAVTGQIDVRKQAGTNHVENHL